MMMKKKKKKDVQTRGCQVRLNGPAAHSMAHQLALGFLDWGMMKMHGLSQQLSFT